MPLSSIFSRRAVRAATAGALLAGSVMVAAVGTTSADGGGLTATMRDNCEATSFNAAIGAGTCVGDGNTTFDQFFAALPTGGHPKWRNQVGSGELKAGQSITVVNRGGEFHSFTEVSKFGGGIVDVINLFGGFSEPAQPVTPFNPATGLVPPGGKTTIGMLAPGTHMFQCMIHPWMRSTITVRSN